MRFSFGCPIIVRVRKVGVIWGVECWEWECGPQRRRTLADGDATHAGSVTVGGLRETITLHTARVGRPPRRVLLSERQARQLEADAQEILKR